MLTQEEALKRLKRLRTDCQSQRAFYDSFWALACIYNHGRQWGYMRPIADGGFDVRHLSHIADPHREDVRVAVNKIHEAVVKLEASLTPERIQFEIETEVAHMGWRKAAQKAMYKHLARIGAMQIIRAREMHRLVFGTCMIRRTLRFAGKPMPVGKTKNRQGKVIPTGIRNVRPGWAIVAPHEILRDPASNTTFPERNEFIFCHEKPRPVSWVRNNFGINPKTTTTLGQLFDYQRQILAAGGQGNGAYAQDSKEPGVVWYECYFQDPQGNPLHPKTGEEIQWPWVLYGYLQQAPNEHQEIIPVSFGPSPYYGLPFHSYKYDQIPQSPWSRGVPHLLQGSQDFFNIAATWYVRIMQSGAGRWRYEKGSIDPTDVAKILSNDIRTAIPYRRVGVNTIPPDRAPAPQVNPAASQFLGQAPTWMMDALNMSDVQFGKGSKRGEAGKAYQVKLGAANAPLEKIRMDDDLVTSDLLKGTLCDLTARKHLRLDEARKLIGDAMPDEFVRDLVREDAQRVVIAVKVHPSMNRPKTPGEIRSDYVGLVEAQVKSAEDAEWEMMLQGTPTNTAMKGAYDKQCMEFRLMEDGDVPEVNPSENHTYHIRTIEWYTDQPAYMVLDDDVKDAAQAHLRAHEEAMMLRAQGSEMMMQEEGQQPGMPSAPNAAAATMAAPPGAVEPGGMMA